MKNSSIKLVALFFILLFSLSPLNAIDLNQCDNATYINCTDMKKDSNVVEINDTIKDNDSDVEIKCINETGNFKNNVGYINQSLNDSNSSKNLKSIDSQVLLCTSIKDVDYGQKPVCKIYIPGGDDFDEINVKVTIQNLDGSGDDYKEYTLSARHRNKFEMKFDDDLKPGRYKLKGKLTVLYPKIGPDGKKHSYTLNSYDYNNFTVRKLKTSLNPHIENFNSGKKPVIKFNCKDNLKGNIIISSPSFSKTYKIPASKGSFKYKLDENLTSGTYKYRVSYSDDIYDAQPFTGNFTVYKHNPNLNRTINHFNKDKNGASSYVQYRYKISSDDDSICRSSTASTTFTVKEKDDQNLSIKVDNITEGQKAIVEITANNNLSGKAEIRLNTSSTSYPVEIINGTANTTIDENLTPGEYNATVKLQGNNSLSGKAEIRLNTSSTSYPVEIINGTANTTIDENLTPGEYKATLKLQGNNTFKRNEKSTTFTVKEKEDQNLSIKVDNITEGQKAIVEITANNSLNGKAEIRLNTSSTSYPVEIINCTANTTIDENLTPGEYNATVKLQGNNSLKPTEKSTTFAVKEKEDQNLSIKVDNITEGQKAIVEITANNNLSGKAEIRLNNSSTSYPVEIINGTANTTIDENLTPGEYNATVYFQGDTTDWAGYNSGSSSGDVAIVGDDAIQIGNSLASKYGFRAGVGSESYESMKKRGYGSCWAWSDALFTELTARGYTCRIVEYPTSMASNHRSVQIKKDNHWKDYPYKKTKIDKLAWATRGSFKGTVVR